MRHRLRFLVLFLLLALLAAPLVGQETDTLVATLGGLVEARDYAGLEAFDWKALKEAYVDWFYRDRNPLSRAVEKEDYRMMAYLVGKGLPDLYEEGQDTVSFLATPVSQGRTEAVRAFMAAGLRPLPNDLFRCDKDSKLEILKLLLPFVKAPMARQKTLEWGEPSGGTYSYLSAMAREEGTDRILAHLLAAYPEAIDQVYSGYSAVFEPWTLIHFTIADIAGERLRRIAPGFKGRKAMEILRQTPYEEIERVFANSFLAMTSDRLRLRSGPGLGAAVLTTLERGTELRVIESDAEAGPKEIDGKASVWYFVVTQKAERGWVWGGYLEPKSLP